MSKLKGYPDLKGSHGLWGLSKHIVALKVSFIPYLFGDISLPMLLAKYGQSCSMSVLRPTLPN
jgi:hypothetical protein